MLFIQQHIEQEYNADYPKEKVRINQQIYFAELFIFFEFSDGFYQNKCQFGDGAIFAEFLLRK